MEKLLEEAFKKASSLPDKDKKAFAAFILEELEHEEEWETLYKKSQSLLSDMAREALTDYEEGDTEELNTDDF